MRTVDYRWKNVGSNKPLSRGFYLLSVTCFNCGEKHIGKMGKGERAPYPSLRECPFCGVRNLHFGTTEQAKQWQEAKETTPNE